MIRFCDFVAHRMPPRYCAVSFGVGGYSVAEPNPIPRPRQFWRARWLRRLAAVIATYLLCWAVTWVFAPAALNRWWAAHHSPTGRDFWGREGPVEFRTGVPFNRSGSDYGPDFKPEGKWWCCVGRPWCPAPFVVASEVAWVNGPLSGYAGTVYFIWTPFGLDYLAQQMVWAL